MRFASAVRLAVLLALPLATACHIRPATGPAEGYPGRTVTAEQIEDSGARTAWDALRLFSGHLHLEGNRIGRRGQSSIHLSSEPLVVMDGVRLAEHGVLRDMSARHLESIQLLTGPHATTYWGTGAGHGVLLIRTRSHDGGAPTPG